MKKGYDSDFQIKFTQEFELCLDRIQEFYSEQGYETLQWWYSKEDEIIDYIESLLSHYPYIGLPVTSGSFKGLRKITYGNSFHKMLNYMIFYAIHESDRIIDVINIIPSRTKRKRVR